jgi:hypothetical protein
MLEKHLHNNFNVYIFKKVSPLISFFLFLCIATVFERTLVIHTGVNLCKLRDKLLKNLMQDSNVTLKSGQEKKLAEMGTSCFPTKPFLLAG